MRRLTRSQAGSVRQSCANAPGSAPIEQRQPVVERQRAQDDVLGAQAIRLARERLAALAARPA